MPREYGNIVKCDGCPNTNCRKKNQIYCSRPNYYSGIIFGEHSYCHDCILRMLNDVVDDQIELHPNGYGLKCEQCVNVLRFNSEFCVKLKLQGERGWGIYIWSKIIKNLL